MEMVAAPLLGLQPTLRRRTFVSGIVVHDQGNIVIRRHLFFQVVEESNEFLGAVPLQQTIGCGGWRSQSCSVVSAWHNCSDARLIASSAGISWTNTGYVSTPIRVFLDALGGEDSRSAIDGALGTCEETRSAFVALERTCRPVEFYARTRAFVKTLALFRSSRLVIARIGLRKGT